MLQPTFLVFELAVLLPLLPFVGVASGELAVLGEGLLNWNKTHLDSQNLYEVLAVNANINGQTNEWTIIIKKQN